MPKHHHVPRSAPRSNTPLLTLPMIDSKGKTRPIRIVVSNCTRCRTECEVVSTWRLVLTPSRVGLWHDDPATTCSRSHDHDTCSCVSVYYYIRPPLEKVSYILDFFYQEPKPPACRAYARA